MKSDAPQTTANFPPLSESPDSPSLADEWAFSPRPGQTFTFAICVDLEATDGELVRTRAIG